MKADPRKRHAQQSEDSRGKPADGSDPGFFAALSMTRGVEAGEGRA
jgi:hypothetical protein